MKSVMLGCVAAVVIAVGAWFVLDGSVQRTAEERFSTQGVRL